MVTFCRLAQRCFSGCYSLLRYRRPGPGQRGEFPADSVADSVADRPTTLTPRDNAYAPLLVAGLTAPGAAKRAPGASAIMTRRPRRCPISTRIMRSSSGPALQISLTRPLVDARATSPSRKIACQSRRRRAADRSPVLIAVWPFGGRPLRFGMALFLTVLGLGKLLRQRFECSAGASSC